LDETNLTFEIGGNAGMIWNMLFTNGELDTTHISRLIQKDDGKLLIYYGTCDENVCVAETSIDELLNTIL